MVGVLVVQYTRGPGLHPQHTNMEITAKLKELQDNRQVSVLSSWQISTAIYLFFF